MPASAECVAAFRLPPFLESKLYMGIPSESLNHNTNFTESCTDGGVKSHGNSTSRSCAAQMTRAGTVMRGIRENFLVANIFVMDVEKVMAWKIS